MKGLCGTMKACADNLVAQGVKADSNQFNKQCRDPMQADWMKGCRDWTECNAYTDTVNRLTDLATKWDCCCEHQPYGSPSGGQNDKCCKLICDYLKTKTKMRDDHCKRAEGAKTDQCKNPPAFKPPASGASVPTGRGLPSGGPLIPGAGLTGGRR